MTTTHQILPAKALQEMRQMAKDRQKKVPSPRGAADFNFHVPAEGTRDDAEVSALWISLVDRLTLYTLLQKAKY